MARTRGGKKAGGKATSKAPPLRTSPALKSGSVSEGTKRKGSAGARNSASKLPVPKLQMAIDEFVSKAGSSKEAAAGAPPKEAEVDIEVVEVDAPTTAAATGNVDSSVKEDATIVEKKGADTTVEEEGAAASTIKDDSDTSTIEDDGDTNTVEYDGDISTIEDDGDTSTIEDEADDTSVVEVEADSSMVSDEPQEKSMNGVKASGDEDAKNQVSPNMKNVPENRGIPEKEEGEVSDTDESSSDIEVVYEMLPSKSKAVSGVPKILHDEEKEDKV